MAAFYFHTVKPIAEHYARWSRDNLATFVAEDSHSRQKGVIHILTDMETMRFTRAIYRFQVLCQAPGINRDTRIRSISRSMRSREGTVLAIIDVIEPWEIEELFSFYQFAREVYDNIFSKIRWDLHSDNPKFDDQRRPPTPDGAFDLDNSWDNYLEGTTLHGLSLLHTVLFKIKDHEHLVPTMQKYINSSYIPFNAMEGTLGESEQYWRRTDRPSERDQRQEERAAFPFRGDIDEPDAPPLAWTIIWYDTYSSLYGYYIPDEMRRCWYVFWDAATLEDNGGKRVLHKQWEELYDDCDPRYDLFC
ncbi:hypothetical protein V500_04048 [Pseudogymnoascus sp. VKM F-4518 (FW-2643)]|nr:hypothetical protein V500_04048 [Pseudogymnoascus sp. VKM F-4518 (FW-2643)]